MTEENKNKSHKNELHQQQPSDTLVSILIVHFYPQPHQRLLKTSREQGKKNEDKNEPGIRSDQTSVSDATMWRQRIRTGLNTR